MTKRQKILNMFNAADWLPHLDGKRCKIISDKDFEAVGLYGFIENHSQHCDVIYARRIIQSLGHRVLIGTCFYVYE